MYEEAIRENMSFASIPSKERRNSTEIQYSRQTWKR